MTLGAHSSQPTAHSSVMLARLPRKGGSGGIFESAVGLGSQVPPNTAHPGLRVRLGVGRPRVQPHAASAACPHGGDPSALLARL